MKNINRIKYIYCTYVLWQAATDEELTLIKSHVASHPDQPLDKPEQFLLELSEIPHFGERVACLIFQSDFNDALNNIANKLNNMKATSGVYIIIHNIFRVTFILIFILIVLIFYYHTVFNDFREFEESVGHHISIGELYEWRQSATWSGRRIRFGNLA